MGEEEIVVAYVPVLHAGYIALFKRHSGKKLYLLGRDLMTSLPGFDRMERDIRALAQEDMKRAIHALGVFSSVDVLDQANVVHFNDFTGRVTMPDEDVSRAVALKFFSHQQVFLEPIFLRWDMENATFNRPVSPDRILSSSAFDYEVMGKAFALAEKSPDWWRQVGALAVRDGTVLISAFNKHMPHEQSLYALGDPRFNFTWGERIEVSNALHAEQGIIAQAARKGIALQDASLYVTTFPCPPCAASISEAGISRVYYSEGYSLTGAKAILRGFGIEIIHIERKTPLS